MFSFGIVLWECVNGPGIHIPYAEYLDQYPHLELKRLIVDGQLRPTMSEFAREAFSK